MAVSDSVSNVRDQMRHGYACGIVRIECEDYLCGLGIVGWSELDVKIVAIAEAVKSDRRPCGNQRSASNVSRNSGSYELSEKPGRGGCSQLIVYCLSESRTQPRIGPDCSLRSCSRGPTTLRASAPAVELDAHYGTELYFLRRPGSNLRILTSHQYHHVIESYSL